MLAPVPITPSGRRSGATEMSAPEASVPAMAKSPAGSVYRCAECGWQAPKWVGRCGECQAWGTIGEAGVSRLVRAGVRTAGPGPVSSPAIPIRAVDARAASARPTGLDELDRVLGGGLVPGAVLLLAGEPGVGK